MLRYDEKEFNENQFNENFIPSLIFFGGSLLVFA